MHSARLHAVRTAYTSFKQPAPTRKTVHTGYKHTRQQGDLPIHTAPPRRRKGSAAVVSRCLDTPTDQVKRVGLADNPSAWTSTGPGEQRRRFTSYALVQKISTQQRTWWPYCQAIQRQAGSNHNKCWVHPSVGQSSLAPAQRHRGNTQPTPTTIARALSTPRLQLAMGAAVHHCVASPSPTPAAPSLRTAT